jgi:hypothetical protein
VQRQIERPTRNKRQKLLSEFAAICVYASCHHLASMVEIISEFGYAGQVFYEL